MPASELYGGIAAFKAMMDIAKSLYSIDSAAARNPILITLQEQILTAQAAQTTLTQQVADLEKQIAEFDRWDREKERYELKQLDRGFIAYVLKEEERGVAAPHAICTNCYERRFKSILQSNGKVNTEHSWVCPSCRAAFACRTRDIDMLVRSLD